MNEYILTHFTAEVKEFLKIPCQSNKNMIQSKYQGRTLTQKREEDSYEIKSNRKRTNDNRSAK